MLSARQVLLVQDSFARILPITPAASADFYARLFAIAPETRALFTSDMAEQGRKLFLMLAAIVDALDRIDEVLPVAAALAVRHVGYGVVEAHYDAVGRALIACLSGALGEAFDAEMNAAWGGAYDILSDHMIAAAREATAR